MIPTGLHRLTAKGSLYGVRTANIFHYLETVGPSSGTSEEDLAERFDTVVKPIWMDAVSSSFSLLCLEVSEVGAGVAMPNYRAISTDNVGLLAAASLPANRTVCISEQSATFQRYGRGRHHISGIPEANEVDNAIDEALYDLMVLLADAITANLSGGAGGGTYQRHILSLSQDNAYPVVHYDVNPQVRTMRSRTPVLC